MDEQFERLERRLQALERKNRFLTCLALLMVGLALAAGCQSSGQSVFLGSDGKSKLVVSAEGLVFRDETGKVEAEFSPQGVEVSGPKERRIRIACDSVNTGLSMFEGESERIALWSDGTESQFVFYDGSNSRRVSLTADEKSTGFSVDGPGDVASVFLLCEDGVARVIQVPASE